MNYDGFFISLKELADSMKPLKWPSSMVVEIGIIHIIKNLPPGSKKVIMPLRVVVTFFFLFAASCPHNVNDNLAIFCAFSLLK